MALAHATAVRKCEGSRRILAIATLVVADLNTMGTEAQGEGIQVKVHFTKKEGVPVRFVSGGVLKP
jgi:hypothetical protein